MKLISFISVYGVLSWDDFETYSWKAGEWQPTKLDFWLKRNDKLAVCSWTVMLCKFKITNLKCLSKNYSVEFPWDLFKTQSLSWRVCMQSEGFTNALGMMVIRAALSTCNSRPRMIGDSGWLKGSSTSGEQNILRSKLLEITNIHLWIKIEWLMTNIIG